MIIVQSATMYIGADVLRSGLASALAITRAGTYELWRTWRIRIRLAVVFACSNNVRTIYKTHIADTLIFAQQLSSELKPVNNFGLVEIVFQKGGTFGESFVNEKPYLRMISRTVAPARISIFVLPPSRRPIEMSIRSISFASSRFSLLAFFPFV